MSWTKHESKEFRRLYAENATYKTICELLNKRMSEVQAKWATELAHGRLRGLTEKRRKARLAMKAGAFDLVIEDGLVIKRYPPRYAQGCQPQIGASSHARVEVCE